MITIEKLNRAEAMRYLGLGNNKPDEKTLLLTNQCEQELLQAIMPKYIYRCFPVIRQEDGIAFENCGLVFKGEDIKKHLDGCDRAVLLCATISANVDRLIRKAQIEDMAKAVILDSLASVAVEQLCDKVEKLIGEEFPDCFKTWRFSPGYGDLPVEIQGELLTVLDAPRKTGICTGESCMLTPVKSVTAVIGLSKKEISKKKRSCNDCNLRETCAFRKAGTRCV